MREINFRFYRLGVGAGEEGYKIGYLQFFYKVALFKALSEKRLNWDSPVLWQSNYQLQVVPNSLLSIKQSSGVGFLSHFDSRRLQEALRLDSKLRFSVFRCYKTSSGPGHGTRPR